MLYHWDLPASRPAGQDKSNTLESQMSSRVAYPPIYPHGPTIAYPHVHTFVESSFHHPVSSEYEYHNPWPWLHRGCTSHNSMAQMNPAELEEFQNLSDRYQADLPGPLIGDKLPTIVLVAEYAQADPAYVVKTTALAETHTAYRAIKGDGQCGWRGVVYAYFEIILKSGDAQLVQQEIVRLRSFEDTMKMAGIEYDIIIDMFDYTWELLEAIRQAVENHIADENVLLAFMNDEIKSNSIVYHFKMMTSAFMQLRADQYEPFLEMSIHEYRIARIDPTNQEIDQIGLQALTDAVISQAGFNLEVLYLDRSEGEEVTPYQFSHNPAGSPVIRLLYRPGHYDIIYQEPNQHVQVFLQPKQTIANQMHPAYTPTAESDLHAYLFPNASCSQNTQAPESFNYVSHNAPSQHMSQYFYPHPDQPVYSAQPCPTAVSSSSPVSSTAGHLPPTSAMSRSSPARSTTISPSPVPHTPSEPQIRLNANVFALQRQHESVPMDTGYQGTAALSPAHFRNHDFQPHMWSAEEEYQTKP